MFTGLVDHTGQVVQINHQPSHCSYWIQSQFNDLVLGESVSVEGICLTVAELGPQKFRCDLSPETLNVTNAKFWELDQDVNLERALRLSDRLGGHVVLGHVDTTLEVAVIKPMNEYWSMAFKGVTADQRKFLLPKGSIAINGVSLTINEVNTDGFSVMLIPHTLSRTSLQNLREGQSVNIEWDYLAKMIFNQTYTERTLLQE